MIGWRVTLWVGIVLLAVWFLYMVRSVLLPFVLAFLISILLEPTIKRLRLRGMSRGAAISIVMVAFFGFFGILSVYLTPVMGNQLLTFRNKVESVTGSVLSQDPNQSFFLRWNPVVQTQPPEEQSVVDRALKDAGPVLERLGLPSQRRAIFEQYVQPYQREIARGAEQFFRGFIGLLGAFASQLLLLVLTPLLVVLLLGDMDRIKRRGALWIPPSIRAGTVTLLQEIGGVFIGYLRGLTTALLLYIGGSMLILTVFGVPYSILLGLLFGALYLIPFIGAGISWSILFLVVALSGKSNLLFIQFGSPWVAAAVMMAIFVIADRAFDMFVYPRVVGRSVGLNPLVSMFVIFSGGALFGLVGMLFAFPLAGAVKIILDRLLKVTSSGGDALRLPSVPLRHRSLG